MAKEVSNNEVSAAQQEGGICYCTLWKAQGRVFSPLVIPVQLWEETCPAGASASRPSLLSQCWGPCASAAAELGHGAVQRPALGEMAALSGMCRWAPGCFGSTEGFGKEQHKCSHRLNTLTAFEGTDSAALNLIPI